MRKRALIAAAICSTVLAAVKQFKPGWNLYSAEQDVQIGRLAAAQIEKRYAVSDDEVVQAYVERIGKALTARSYSGQFQYTFKVVVDDGVNAFALPGGPTYVQTGLILFAENEGQFAGVLAHEISHCALRHATHQASKAKVLQLPAALAGSLGPLAGAGAGLGMNGFLLKFSRGSESEADLNGAQMMAAAGYNPIELARFFEKLESDGGKQPPQFLSSHPNPGNRGRAIERQLIQMPKREYAAEEREFRAIQARVSRMTPPPSKTQPQRRLTPLNETKLAALDSGC